jgi:hypothetical protein
MAGPREQSSPDSGPGHSYPDRIPTRLYDRNGRLVDTGSMAARTVFTSREDDAESPPNEPDGRLVLAATPHEMLLYRLTTDRFCGNCRQWDHEMGQRMMAQERFWERLQREQGWRGGEKWHGPRDEYGLCKERGYPTPRFCPADEDPTDPGKGCDLWRPSVGTIVRSFWKGLPWAT